MYEEHWNLSRRPFENKLDSQFYYPAETHQAAVVKLHYAIENRRAAALLCGPSGMGKTLVIDAIERQLSDETGPVAKVVFPAMESEQFVRFLVDSIVPGAQEPVREAAADLRRFEDFLNRNVQSDRHAVVFVDEAHLLEQYDLLEPLRLLLNVAAQRSQGESAWTLVLAGQPTLLSQVERYHALDERMAVKCMLSRLLPEETTAYIQHRVRQAGVDAEALFDDSALDRIHVLTDGIPRRINRLCDLALMVGFAEDRPLITADVIDSVHLDLATPSIA